RAALVPKVRSLADFDTASDAADVSDLRAALGLPPLRLFGVSYGTRLALAVLRDHADDVASAVIDSVLPTQVDLVADSGRNANRAFERIFEGCAADAACAAAYPDLRQAFYDGIALLDVTPA